MTGTTGTGTPTAAGPDWDRASGALHAALSRLAIAMTMVHYRRDVDAVRLPVELLREDVSDAVRALGLAEWPASGRAEPTQADALRVSAELVERIGGAADVTAYVSPGRPVRIVAQVCSSGCEAEELATLRRAAERLGLDPVARFDLHDKVVIDLRMTLAGFPVTVWTLVQEPEVMAEARAWIAEHAAAAPAGSTP